MQNMLGMLSLSDFQGPRDDLEQKLAGPEGPEWLSALKRFLRKENPWKVKPSVSPAEPVSKFALLVDFGTITVPEDYNHATQLTSFKEKNRKKFYYYDDAITDQNFPNPSRVLKPGDKLRVRAFKQVVGGTTTSEERMAFLKSQNAVFVGAQGASLVFEQKSDQLPKGKWYASFDEPDRLWKDSGGSPRVPFADRRSGGVWCFNLGVFECVWYGDLCLLCFCDLPAQAGAE